MGSLQGGGALLVLLVIAGCTDSGPAGEAAQRADEAQSAVAGVIDCNRLAGAPVAFVAHRSSGPARAPAPIDSSLNVQLHTLGNVSPVLAPGRQAKSEHRFAGLVPIRVEAGGTYTVLIASLAWADVGEPDPPRLLQPESFKWITVCGTRFKSGLYIFESGKVYLLQLWDSPDRELNVVIAKLP